MSGLRSFGGEFRKAQKVSLVGRSRGEETRAEVLERTRRERERRRRERQEQSAATVIQAAWRGWSERQHRRAEVRAAWQARYGAEAERASSMDLAPASGFLRQLCFFAKPAVAGDLRILAAACRLVLTSQQPQQAPAAAGAAPQPPQLLFCMHAAGGGQQAATVVWQAQRLASLCLAAVAQHAPAVAAELAAPRLGSAAAATAASTVPPILEALLLLTAPDSWKAALGAVGAAEATAQILAAAASGGLFGQLAAIAAAACPEDGAAAAGDAGAAQAARQAVPSGEAVVTALTVRYLSQQAAIVRRLEQRQQRKQAAAPQQQAAAVGQPGAAGVQQTAQQTAQPPAASQQGNTSAERQLPLLLCVPLLLRRLPTLKPAAARLWRHTVAALHGLAPSDLAAWLRAQHPGSEAALAGAALLGNLLDGAAAALKAEDAQQLAAVRQPALQFAALACSLLALLPQQPFFPSSGDGEGGMGSPQAAGSRRWAEDDEDEEAQVAVRRAAAAAAPAAAKLPWDAEQLPSAGLVAQLQLVADSGLLRSLVRAVLPQADAASGGAAQGPALAQCAADVRRLCSLLQQLMALPGQRQRLLVVLAFSAELVQRLWFSYLRPAQASPVEGWVPSADASCDPGWMLPLTLFSLAYSSFIMTAGDDELYTAQRPLPLAELHSAERPGGGVLALLKMALWHALWVEAPPAPGGWSLEAAALRSQLKEAAGKLMGQLHDRNCRRAFAPAEAFQADTLPADRFQSEVQAATAAGRGLDEEGAGRAWGLLAHAPYLVPFRERAKLFQAVVAQERARYRDMELMQSFAAELGVGGGNRFFPVRRTQVLEDAYDQLNGLGEGLHGRIRIQFIDAHGLEEAGVDGGGIFKEFVETVVREGFNPEAGLFQATTDNRLYPNPHAQLVAGNALRLIEFLGRMLGKAMYEGILVELPLAPFFLKKFRGAYCDINDLPTLDPELYRNLVFLKRYTGDVADLGLTFTITDNVLGVAREVELAPRGHDTSVTADNRLAYIHRVADYRLNRQIREPAAAFLRGLHDLIKPEWVRMFNEEELQMLISGGQQGLDIADMRAHVQYSGGYHEEHPVILEFWRALATFSPQEQGDFLRFVTSCPRPPLLGFRYLEPPLAIQLAGSMLDEQATERLPTAATCMNVLKLPPYRTAQQIRDKLLYAIQSGAGFELS